MNIDRLLERQETMESDRSNWESTWERVARMVLPRADDFRSKHSPGGQRNQQQYDAFPMAALDKFAAAMEAGTMPRTTYWHRLTTGDDELDENHEVSIYLEKLNGMLWRTRYAPMANFTSQAHEKRLSLGAFGTGCMLVQAAKGGGISYRSIHLSEIFIDENEDGFVDTVHRKFELSVRQAIRLFGKDAPDKVIQKHQAGKLADRFEFVHCVSPREDYEHGRMDERGMPFAGYYIYPDGKQIIRSEGFRSQPYIVSRYTKSTREIYGRSPAIMLLPDISMLNEMRRTTIEAANMAVDKPTLQHDDVSEFDLVPGARNPGTLDDNGNPLVRPWDSDPRVDIGMDMIADTRSQIDDGFMGAYFRVLLENPNMTATQAMLIAQQQGQMTAPAVGRQQSEWLGPMIRREASILNAQGRTPAVPAVLAEYLQETKQPLGIRYESPMVRAAKAEESVGILRTFETLAPMAQVDPDIYRMFDTQAVARVVAEVNGVPAKVLKPKEQIAAEDEASAMQEQAAQMLEAAPIAAQTAKTMIEAQNMAQAAPGQIGR